jgi:hypothetical protein
MDGALKALVRQGIREWNVGLQIHRFCMDARAQVYEVVVFYELISASILPGGIFAKLFLTPYR